MARVIQFEGRQISVPDDATDEEIAQIIEATPAPAAAQPVNTAADVAQSFGSGAVRGTAELAMTPVTVPRMVQEYVLDPTIGRAADFAVNTGEDLVRYIMGKPPLTDQVKQERRQRMTDSRTNNPLAKGQDVLRKTMNENLYQPQTTAGEFARTIGEFAVPGAALGKGGMASRAVGDVLIPALFSESAGQMTEGTAMEGPARFAGALVGSGGVGLVRSRSNAPEVAIRNATTGLSADDIRAAAPLQQNEFGINVSAPNAVQQSTGGATKLADLQRVVEGSSRGGSKMAPYFAAVPGQTDDAVGRVLDDIAPRSSAPSTIGPRVQTAAQGVIDDARGAINDASATYYRASDAQPLPFVDLAKDPNYARTVDWVRANVPKMADKADNSVEMVNAVSKRLFEEADAAANSANSNFSNLLAADRGDSARAIRDMARSESRNFDTALNIQETRRTNILDPLEQGPVGKLAATPTTQGAANIVTPAGAKEGSEMELFKALGLVGEKDPEATASLVRQVLGDAYQKNATNLSKGTRNYYGGSNFAKEIAGTAQEQANTRAAVSAVGGDARRTDTLLDVLRATGQRAPIGSQTAFNAEMQRELGSGSLPVQIADALTSMFGTVRDATQRAYLGRNVETLADMFMSPQGVEEIANIVASRPETAMSPVLAPTIRTTPQLRDREKERKK